MLLNKKLELILASGSPRRQEILSWLEIPFQVYPPEIEEVSIFSDPVEIVIDLAKQKGQSILKILNEKRDEKVPLIISSDTMVVYKNKIFGKPKSIDEARETLLFLSGKTHEVLTSVYMGMSPDGALREYSFCEKTEVTFDSIDTDLLDFYLASGEYMDKAGAYGIQGKALTFISHLNGSYSNVVGFPINEFIKNLKTFLETFTKADESWRSLF